MPKVPVDYSKTCIYKLVHKDDVDNENIYIGSTTNFIQRKWDHATCCNRPNQHCYNTPKYQYIRANGGWKEWVMVEIEKYPCNDKKEAESRERYWIELLKSNLNKNLPIRTHKEYYETNREILLDKMKIYRDKNQEQLLEQKKEYYQNNRDKIIEYRKQYHIDNKEKINMKIRCECGCEVGEKKLKRHQMSEKHKKLMEGQKKYKNLYIN